MRKIVLQMIALLIFAAFFTVSVAFAAPRVCILKYDGSTNPWYKTGTPCTDAAAAYPAGGGKNLVTFSQGCGGDSYKVVAIFEQDPSNRTGVDNFELFMGFNATIIGGPASSTDCNINPFYSLVFDKTCPGGSGSSSYVHIASAALTSTYPTNNIELFSVDFKAMNYSPANHVTAPVAWINKLQSNIYNPLFEAIADFIYQDADFYCENPVVYVLPPTSTTITKGSTICAGNPPVGTEQGIAINFTPSAQCYYPSTGITGVCPTGCNPGVTVKKTLPVPVMELATKTTANTVTDTNGRGTGTQITYELTGGCAGTSASDSQTKVTLNHTPECSQPPNFTTVAIGGKTPDDATVGGVEGYPIRITGTIADPDSIANQLHVKLHYGAEDGNPAFPAYVSTTVADNNSFIVDIPASAVRKNVDIYWALEVYDETHSTGYAPVSYVSGNTNTAYSINGNNIFTAPPITDNQNGDDEWRGSNTATYDVDFRAPEGHTLNKFQARACPTETNCGNLIDWTDVSINLGPANLYTTDWPLPTPIWSALSDGAASYISVQAFDDSGIFISTGPVFYVKKDTTPPSGISTVNDGLSVDAAYATTSGQLSANWSTSVDAQSDIAGYWFAIGTTSGATNTLDWTNNGLSTAVTKTGLTLANGAKYYFSIKATNKAGLFSVAANSNGQVYDVTPPDEVSGLTASGDDSQIDLTWSNPSNADFARVAIIRKTGSYPASPADGAVAYQGTLEFVNDAGLTTGTQYYYKAFAFDVAGNQTTGNSPGARATIAPEPQALIIHQGWNQIGASGQNATLDALSSWGTATYSIATVSNGVLEFATSQQDFVMALATGYWVYSDNEIGSIAAGGSNYTGATYTVSLGAGWNMFSLPFNSSLIWNNQFATLTCGGAPLALQPIYNYRNEEYSRIEPNLNVHLAPWRGYFIKLQNQCSLLLSNSP